MRHEQSYYGTRAKVWFGEVRSEISTAGISL